jgi:hypothetical protein
MSSGHRRFLPNQKTKTAILQRENHLPTETDNYEFNRYNSVTTDAH